MTYSPDFSSASPASNWVTPPASSIPSADYTYQPDTYADASQSAEAVYVPTAPLMQAPVQDVYSPPAPQPIAGTVSSADSYTPSFATPSAPEAADAEEANKPIPFIGNHPTQTLLATGVGAFGGALIGGAVKHLVSNDDAEIPKPTSKVQDATVKDNWTIVDPKDLHPDGKPKQIKDTKNNRIYTIKPDGAVTGVDNSGVAITANTPVTESHWTVKDGDTIVKTVQDGERTYKKIGNSIELALYESKSDEEVVLYAAGSFVFNPAKKVAVQLDDNRNIIKVITNLDEQFKPHGNIVDRIKGSPAFFWGSKDAVLPNQQKIKEALEHFPNEVIPTNSKETALKWWGKQPTRMYASNPNHLGIKTQQLLAELRAFDFDKKLTEINASSTATNGFYATWDALRNACDFKPAVEATKEAAEKAAKEIKWGELVLPALAGAGIVGAGVFVADFILQRRKPKATTTEPEGA